MLCKAAQENGYTYADIYRAFNGTDGLRPSGTLFSPNYQNSDKGKRSSRMFWRTSDLLRSCRKRASLHYRDLY